MLKNVVDDLFPAVVNNLSPAINITGPSQKHGYSKFEVNLCQISPTSDSSISHSSPAITSISISEVTSLKKLELHQTLMA